MSNKLTSYIREENISISSEEFYRGEIHGNDYCFSTPDISNKKGSPLTFFHHWVNDNHIMAIVNYRVSSHDNKLFYPKLHARCVLGFLVKYNLFKNNNPIKITVSHFISENSSGGFVNYITNELPVITDCISLVSGITDLVKVITFSNHLNLGEGFGGVLKKALRKQDTLYRSRYYQVAFSYNIEKQKFETSEVPVVREKTNVDNTYDSDEELMDDLNKLLEYYNTIDFKGLEDKGITLQLKHIENCDLQIKGEVMSLAHSNQYQLNPKTKEVCLTSTDLLDNIKLAITDVINEFV